MDNRNYVSKGWGYEDWIVNRDDYCGKVLFVKRGRRCSLHYHVKKHETFYLQSGKILLRHISQDDFAMRREHHQADEVILNNCPQLILRPGDSFTVPPLLLHQFEGLLDSVIIEFSTYHLDSDSYRIVKGH